MSDFEAQTLRQDQRHAGADDIPPLLRAEAPPSPDAAQPWTPYAPAPVQPLSSPYPGLFTSAGVDDHAPRAVTSSDHSEMVWKNDKPAAPTLMDFYSKMASVDGAIDTLPPDQGRGPLRSVFNDMQPGGHGDPSAPPPSAAMQAGMNHYADQTRTLSKDWQHLDPAVAANSLRGSMNDILASEQVPPMGASESAPPPGADASFEPSSWSERITCDKPFRSADDVKQLGKASFHEATHAEEYFDAARYEVSQNSAGAADGLIDGDVASTAQRVEAASPMSAAEKQSAQRMAGDVIDNTTAHKTVERAAGAVIDNGNAASAMVDKMEPDASGLASLYLDGDRPRMVGAVDRYYQLPSEQAALANERLLGDKLEAQK